MSLIFFVYVMFQIVFYKLINIINMSTSQIELLGQRRTSRRRKIKTQKVLDQYMILNPFKKNSRSTVIPDQLNKQLRKLEYLSNANLEKIKLRKTAQEQNQNLSRMRKASFEQEEKYLSYLKDWPALQTSCSLNFISSNTLKPVSKKNIKNFVTSITHFDIQNLVEHEDSKIDEECVENIEQMNPESNLFSDNYDNKNIFPELKHDVHIDNMQNENQNDLTHVVPHQQYDNNYQIDELQEGLFNLRTENHEIEETLYYGDYGCSKSKQHQFSYYYH